MVEWKEGRKQYILKEEGVDVCEGVLVGWMLVARMGDDRRLTKQAASKVETDPYELLLFQ